MVKVYKEGISRYIAEFDLDSWLRKGYEVVDDKPKQEKVEKPKPVKVKKK